MSTSLRRRHVHQRPDLTGRKPATVVDSFGAGVDSMAILHRWCHDPSSRDFELDELLVIIALTGDEYDSTIAAVNKHAIPLMRQHGIRFMQVARGGQAASEGYDVMADSTAPTEMIPRGAWHLGQEMAAALTLPQIADKKRTCSAHAKGEVLDAAIADELAAGTIVPGFRHAIGYAAEEVSRQSKDCTFTTNSRRPWYPLIDDWKWDRDACAGYLFDAYNPPGTSADEGFHWPRSCCKFCCFQASVKGQPALAKRWRDEPDAAAEALRLEGLALPINRHMRLFGTLSAADFVRQQGLSVAAGLAADHLANVEQWTVAEVRRVYRPASWKDPVTGKTKKGSNGRTIKDPSRKGDTWRSLRPVATMRSRQEALAVLDLLAEEYDAPTWTGFDKVPRAEVTVVPAEVRQWPITEHQFVVVPTGPVTKERSGFAEEWRDALSKEATRGGSVRPLPLIQTDQVA